MKEASKLLQADFAEFALSNWFVARNRSISGRSSARALGKIGAQVGIAALPPWQMRDPGSFDSLYEGVVIFVSP